MALAQQIIKPLKDMTLLDNVALAAGGGKLLSPIKTVAPIPKGTGHGKYPALMGLAHVVHKHAAIAAWLSQAT